MENDKELEEYFKKKASEANLTWAFVDFLEEPDLLDGVETKYDAIGIFYEYLKKKLFREGENENGD